MRIHALLSPVLLLTTVALCQNTTRPKHAPAPDSEAAIARAEAVLIPVYGKKQIESERPFTATLKGDVWTVWGTLHCPDGKGGLTSDCLGGVAVVKIAKGNGRILHMGHGKRSRASLLARKMPSHRRQLKFHRLPGLYAILRLTPDASVPAWATKGEFTSITRTADELSLVCPTGNLPADVHSPHRWICLKLEGPFPFSQTGVLLSFIEPLSNNEIPIFAISTYDTDYVLVPEEYAASAVELLREAGHALSSVSKPI